MTNNAQSLPTELLLTIFNKVQIQGGHLAASRLVCRAWKPLAESVLYKQINMNDWSQDRYTLLSKHLSARPDFGQLVQKITVSPKLNDQQQLRQVLKVMPALKIIDGYWGDKVANAVLLKGDLSLVDLQQLPLMLIDSTVYLVLQERFKDSLRSGFFQVTPENLNSLALHQYRHLTRLRLRDAKAFQNIKQLEKVLQGFTQATELQLEILQYSHYTHTTPADLKHWLMNSVKKITSTRILKIRYADNDMGTRSEQALQTVSPDWMEYLAYKYPNVETFRLNNQKYNRQSIVLPTFQHLQTFDIQNLKFYDMEALRQFVDMFANRNVRIEWKQQEFTEQGQTGISMMSASNTENARLTNFEIKGDYMQRPDTNTPAIISMFLTRNIKHWTITIFKEFSSTMLNHIFGCHVESLRVAAKTLSIKEGDHLQTAAALEKLELVDVTFGTKFITRLSESAPNLKHLTLSNCSLTHINLAPSSQLSSLTICHESNSTFYANVKKFLFHVSMALHSRTHIFFVAAGKPLEMITEQKFKTCVNPIIYIKCGALQDLKVDIREIKFAIKFDTENGLINSAIPGIEESI